MGLLDGMLGQSGIDIGALAKQVGLSEDQVRVGGEAILGKLGQGGVSAQSAATAAAAETGIDAGKLMALLPMLAGMLGTDGGKGIADKLGLTGDGMMGSIGDMLDRDKDGNPIDDILGMAGGFLGRK